MNAQFVDTFASYLALLLLFCCVILFTYSNQNIFFNKNCRILLLTIGVIPGGFGVVYGFYLYAQGSKSLLVIIAFLLLEVGAASLLSARKRYEMNGDGKR